MPFHHVAVAAQDMPAIDAFYSEATGFDLVKVEIASRLAHYFAPAALRGFSIT